MRRQITRARMHYQQRARQRNREVVLWWIIQGADPSGFGATFQELRRETGLSAPALSSHLRDLVREDLIERRYDEDYGRSAYCIVDTKAELLGMLRNLIEREKEIVKDNMTELQQLEQVAQKLEQALRPFGRLPCEIRKLQQEYEEILAKYRHMTLEQLRSP